MISDFHIHILTFTSLVSVSFTFKEKRNYTKLMLKAFYSEFDHKMNNNSKICSQKCAVKVKFNNICIVWEKLTDVYKKPVSRKYH